MIIWKVSILLIISGFACGVMALTNYSVSEVYAADNCDATSTCTNVDIGTDNTQINNCIDSTTCDNSANGDRNTQTNECASVGTPGCFNTADPLFAPTTDDNIQSNDCTFGEGFQCSNEIVGGNKNIQNNQCQANAQSDCVNFAFDDGNTQFNDCIGEGFACQNQGIGSSNQQKIECKDNGAAFCINQELGNENIQTIDCRKNEVIECSNDVGQPGDRNNMNVHCENKAVGFEGCSNFVVGGSDNTENVDCKSVGTTGCNNILSGNRNTQSIKCNSVGNDGCQNTVINFESGLDPNNNNIQTIKCKFVSGGCENIAIGNGNVQDINCIRSTQCSNVINSPSNGNTQKTLCVNTGSCQNSGTDSKLVSIKSDKCESNSVAGSTTICVNNRIINRP